jgi:histidinol-phosphate aminotransferase
MYGLQCIINKGINIEVPLVQSDYSLDTDKVITTENNLKPKIIFLCNPNNPTGTIIEQKDIENILKNTGSIVVVDEVYREFYGKSSLSFLNHYKNLIILRSFSKFASLAGARVGYIIANPKYVQIFEAIRFPMGVSFLSYKLAEYVLEKGMRKANNNIGIIIKERKRIIEELMRLGLFVYPSEANFLLVNVGDKARTICKLLKRKKIIIRDRSNKKYLEGCIRITVRSPKENMILIKTLKEIL